MFVQHLLKTDSYNILKFGTTYVEHPVYVFDIAAMINVYAIDVNRSIWYFRRTAPLTKAERYLHSARASIYTAKCKYRCQSLPCSLSATRWPLCTTAHMFDACKFRTVT